MKILKRLQEDWRMATEIHKLEARLWHQAQRDGIQVVLVTSGARGEGKSTTVAYLAAALGQYVDRRVLTVDLDLRAPRIGQHFEATVIHGVDAVLRGEVTPAEAVIPTGIGNLDLLLPPDTGADPKLLLHTQVLHGLFRWAKQQYDFILVDAPALMPVADTSILIPMTDGVLLSAIAGKTTKAELTRAREQCLGMGANVLGLVVGNLQEALPDYGGDGNYYSYGKAGGLTSDSKPTLSGDDLT